MANETKRIGSALIDAFNAQGNLDQWATQLAPGFAADYPGAPGLNAQQAREYNEAFRTAFPDLRFESRRVFEDGDGVVVEWTASGTHAGPLAAPNGQTIPATGKRVTERGVLSAQVRNGRIVHEATYWNLFSVLTQIGLAR